MVKLPSVKEIIDVQHEFNDGEMKLDESVVRIELSLAGFGVQRALVTYNLALKEFDGIEPMMEYVSFVNGHFGEEEKIIIRGFILSNLKVILGRVSDKA